jgi:glycosyltransferase involved in cell wall biosynthesis
VNLERFTYHPQKADFFLTVCRLVSYKQIKLIVQAFNQLKLPLVVIGDGPDMAMLKAIAKPNIQLLGTQPNAVVEDYMARAKAFVYAACEDFGIAPVEAQACGTPVIAFGKGGALETVVDYYQNPQTATGIWFHQQTPPSLIEAVETFCTINHQINPENCRLQANRFSSRIFKTSYLTLIEKYCQEALP